MNKILKLRGYFLFLSLGLVIFFLGALIVVLVRTKSSSSVTMPSLVGKNYNNVHNELVRLRLKILLEEARIPEKNEGEVLSQSVSPGKAIETGSHVYLTVNTGFDRVEMPNLKGQSLERATELLGKVLSGEIYVSMPIGGITYVEAGEGESANSVIEQIPEPGKITHSGEKVYLLVATASTKPGKKSDQSSFINQPLPFVAEALNRKKLPWRVIGWEKSLNRESNGLVMEEKSESNTWEFKVNRIEDYNRIEEGYEFLTWKAPKDGVYQVQLVKGELGKLETVYLPAPKKKGEEINLAFYRQGKLTANIMTIDEKVVDSVSWKSEL
ncbi:MAG: PASTA domain-containing protein [Leptospira sp.]|nr:PASTA domain-containing protein [Leptospira sp.]